MEILKAINATLAFLLELAMLAALGYWGFHGDKSIWIKLLLGIGAPVAAGVAWALFLAPNAQYRLSITAGAALSLALFLLAAAAFYQTGHTQLAMGFALIAVVNQVLMLVWKQW